ncbi:putative leader peptide [Actinocrinis sp.]
MVRSELLVARLHVDLRRQASALCAGCLGHTCC